jgi:formate dehydrogenase accessory protein FdhD
VTGSAAAVEEVPWWLDVNGERVATGTVLPRALEPFFVGRLATDGVIARRDHILSLEIDRVQPGVLAARALVPLARARTAGEERRHRSTHGCGVLYVATCHPSTRFERRPVPEGTSFTALFRALFADAETRHEGGVHAVALSEGTLLRHQHEDVGRHNAVDKAIGAALLAGDDLTGHGLLLSSRVSGDIAAKAARCGIAWIASRSVPTTLALRIANVCGVAIVARAAGKHAIVHAPEVGR